MSTKDKIIRKVLYASVQSISFEELQYFLVRVYNMRERVIGDHFIYKKDGISEIINIQPRKDGMAKSYQVRQVREIVKKYGGV